MITMKEHASVILASYDDSHIFARYAHRLMQTAYECCAYLLMPSQEELRDWTMDDAISHSWD
jgi:hypothetical protein